MINWNPDADFWAQDPETQEAVFNAMGNPPTDQATEPAGDGSFERVLWQVYQAEEIQVKLTYIYANPSDSAEWAALSNFTIEKVS